MQLDSLAPHLVRRGDVVLDIGANVGQTARVLAPLVGPDGRCLCFEAEPHAFRSLASLAADRRFANVEPYCRAMSDRVGHEELFFGTSPDAAQASTMVKDLANTERLGDVVIGARIESDTIDRFCASREIAPSFIKVDVEGAEDRVFAGAAAVLTAHHPPVVFEFGYQIDGGPLPSHFRLFDRLGYRFFVMDVMFKDGKRASLAGLEGQIAAIDLAQLTAHRVGGNLLAIPASALDRISAVPRTDFEAVARRITLDVPAAPERARAALERVESATLKAVERSYRAVRWLLVSGALRILRAIRSGRT